MDLCYKKILILSGAREGRVRGSADPPSLYLELKSEIAYDALALRLNKCIYHLRLMSLPPHIALTISTISRGAVKINVSCDMIKLIFDLDPPVKNGFPRACILLFFTIRWKVRESVVVLKMASKCAQ